MERIKQAVDKARENRDILREVVPHALHIDPAEKPESRQQNINTFSYTKTKTISIKGEVLRNNRIISNLRDSNPVTNAYKMLRTRILQQMKQNGWKTLGVTSPGIGEGKTLTAINLAISLAAEGNHSVLLADFDLRHPGVASKLGYDPVYDISHYLFDAVPFNEVLFNPGIERLVVLPAGRRIPNSSETLLSPVIANLVEDVKTRYASRIIIFDLPPLLATDDVLAFSPLLDSVLLVIEEGKTRKDDLLRSMEMLRPVEVAGVVLNKSPEKPGSY